MKKIIIADDDPAIGEIFNIILKRAGYDVTLYSNGEALMNNDFERPDMFLLDKQLSGIDGLEVCRFLKSQEATKNTPIIIISASSKVAGAAEEAGADEFLEKPFTIKGLTQTIEKYMNKN